MHYISILMNTNCAYAATNYFQKIVEKHTKGIEAHKLIQRKNVYFEISNAITMGICAYGSQFITKPFNIMYSGTTLCFTTFEIVPSFMGARFVNKQINENKHGGFTFTGPIKAVCGVVLRSLSMTFMTICCCISHRYAVKIRSISLIWWIMKM